MFEHVTENEKGKDNDGIKRLEQTVNNLTIAQLICSIMI